QLLPRRLRRNRCATCRIFVAPQQASTRLAARLLPLSSPLSTPPSAALALHCSSLEFATEQAGPSSRSQQTLRSEPPMCRTSLVLLVALTLVVSCAPLSLPVRAQEQAANAAPPQIQMPAQTPAKQTPPPSQTQKLAPADKQIEKIKRVVNKVAVGNRITVYLKNGDDLHGTVTNISANDFDIAEVDFHKLLTINYTDVKKVREGYGEINLLTGKRRNPPRGFKIAAFAGLAALLIIPIIIYATGPPD